MPSTSRRASAAAAFTLTALLVPFAPAHAEPAPTSIAAIQGAGHTSPLVGTSVRAVPGVVIARNARGFWMQSLTPDANPATSEGLYVYSPAGSSAEVGARVEVDGTVTEFRPGGSSGNDNLSTTEITEPVVRITGTATVPKPVVLGIDRIAPQQQIRGDNPGSVEKPGAPFDPARNALDFYESMEGMRVGVRDAVAVGPTNLRFGELPVVPGQRVQATRSRAGGVIHDAYTRPNSMRVILDDPLLAAGSLPTATTGDRLPGLSSGVLDYSFANFKLLLTTAPAHRSVNLKRESTARAAAQQLAVATFNVENLAPADPATKYQRLARQIVSNLASPDVLALEEIQDNSGAANDGVTTSEATSNRLIQEIRAAGGPLYQARWVDPQNNLDGGQPGGNIRQVFLYRTDRGVQFIDRPGGSATTATQVVGTGAQTALSASPGRIEPGNAAWSNSRKPLAGQFRFRNRSYFVIANHFTSKGADDPLFGRWQQPKRFSETQRHQQARVVRGFVDRLLSADRNAQVVVLGDLNDFEFSTTTNLLAGSGPTGLLDLPRRLGPAERYSYVYEGNSQVLDHIMISPSLARPQGRSAAPFEYDIVHTNADFPDQDSDHDPQVVRLGARNPS